LHQIKRYDEQVILDNWFVEPAAKVTIALKANLSPQENAERFYRKAKAVQSNRKEMNIRLEHAKKRRAICAELEEKLAPAFRGKALEKVKLAMIAQGWYTAETAKEKRQMDPKTTYTTEFLIDDHEVLVGKDAKSNDYLSLKMAKANDIWFHVQGSPGSHVVLRWHGNKDNPPKDLVQKVASLTAFYSKQKNAGTIPVIYTQAKYVRKPRGAKAGAVTVQNEKSVFVKPKAYEDLV
jgi:predicted ribosome quality control (RQC) complex YloA/Tae2 family protein